VFSQFVEKTATEKDNLFYGFTVNGDEIFGVKPQLAVLVFIKNRDVLKFLPCHVQAVNADLDCAWAANN
jgi:hypothetical protein